MCYRLSREDSEAAVARVGGNLVTLRPQVGTEQIVLVVCGIDSGINILLLT
jgi:hypothetical protein